MRSKLNRYLEAFKESHNLVGLATAFSLSAALGNPLPLLVCLVAEAAYLVFVPDSKWYESRLSRRYDAEVLKQREALKAKILPLLRPDMKERFSRMEAMLRGIQAQSTDNSQWFREVLRKLDFLLDKFLDFASKEVQFRTYLMAVLNEVRGGAPQPAAQSGPADTWDAWPDDDDDDDAKSKRSRQKSARSKANAQRSPANSMTNGSNGPAPKPLAQASVSRAGGSVERGIQTTVAEIQSHYDGELAELKSSTDQEQDEGTKAVLKKRVDVVQRRREFIGKIGKVLVNLNHQLLLMEDTFGLISDEIRARPPEQVLSDIDDVVFQTKTMTELLEEVGPYENAIASSSV